MAADGSGLDARRFTLTSDTCRAVLTDLGARLLELHVPDRTGAWADVVLQRPTFADVAEDPAYMGATVGRCANRTMLGRAEIDGAAVQLSINEGRHHLHGGVRGFDRRLWSADASDDEVSFHRVSPAGEEGYPGTLTTRVTYRLSGSTLSVGVRASTDAPTVVNVVHHSYFNLAGHDAGTIDDHVVTVHASHYLPVDQDLIPTGEVRAVAGTPFDFREPAPIGGRVFDHNWVLDDWTPDVMRDVAVVHEPRIGRRMTVSTNQPGLQLYTGEHLAGLTGKGAVAGYPAFAGLALEAQGFPDAVHHEHFPSTALLPGQTYVNDVAFAFASCALPG
ncbi:aldose epimerase family protein [Mycolicibacterium lacusdiani]|uniref:aldose epimerase family protein n=1 Tax=Mycolicibacterium lacusdiani TaxID=2895283 RepID=UPI001F19C049|nr:aldose epimerase family protein [Mycolicibacterium lacusdiani]